MQCKYTSVYQKNKQTRILKIFNLKEKQGLTTATKVRKQHSEKRIELSPSTVFRIELDNL